MLSLSFNQHLRHSVVDKFKVFCAKGFCFDSYLADFLFGNIFIDAELNWKDHILHLTSSVAQSVGAL